MASCDTCCSSTSRGSGRIGGRSPPAGGRGDPVKDQIAHIAAALASHDVPARLFSETQYVMRGLTSKQYLKLLSIFSGKDEKQLAFMFTAGVRNRMWTQLHAIKFPSWLRFLKWIPTSLGQTSIADVALEEKLVVGRNLPAFSEDQAVLFSAFDVQRNDLLQNEKRIRAPHEEIIQKLKFQLKQQRALMKEELAENKQLFLPFSAYNPPKYYEFDERCWTEYRTTHAGEAGIGDHPTVDQFVEASTEFRYHVRRKYELEYLAQGVNRDQLMAYAEKRRRFFLHKNR